LEARRGKVFRWVKRSALAGIGGTLRDARRAASQNRIAGTVSRSGLDFASLLNFSFFPGQSTMRELGDDQSLWPELPPSPENSQRD